MPIRKLHDSELFLLLPLFRDVFRASASIDLMAWKYAAGRGASWGFWNDEGELCLHCGVMYREILLGGTVVRAGQLVDLMARRKAGLARASSPFAQLLSGILRGLPDPRNPGGFAFGLPSNRAMRLAETLKLIRTVARVAKLTLYADNKGYDNYVATPWLDPTDSDVISRLWADMRTAFADRVIGIRDFNYLRHRYFSLTERQHMALLVRKGLGEDAIGLAVLRLGSDSPELLDVVGSPTHFPEVFSAVRHWLSRQGLSATSILVSEPHATELSCIAQRCDATEFTIMGNPHCDLSVYPHALRPWWFTGGDTDYR